MADSRGRQHNLATRGRRVYANPNAEPQAPLSPWDARPRTGKMLAQFEKARHDPDAESRNSHDSKLQDANGALPDVYPESQSRSHEQEARNSPAVNGSQGSQSLEATPDNDLRIAASVLLERASNSLFTGLCDSCSASIKDRLTSIAKGNPTVKSACTEANHSCNEEGKLSCDENLDERDKRLGQTATQQHEISATTDSSGSMSSHLLRSGLRSSIRDAPAYRTRSLSQQAALSQTPDKGSLDPSRSNTDRQRILNVVRKKDFCFVDRVGGDTVNILEGLELHTNVLNEEEQHDVVNYVYELRELGRMQKLRRRTYSEPRKWMRGKGRATIQFGCCYNYATDKDGNPPGIIREEEVDKIPPKFCTIIKRLVEWHVLPPSCIPDSCIVNIYDVGDCIPPHIDHHDFVRPFCTLSLLSECKIIFGTNLKIAGPGEFLGSFSLPLPVGSVLILNGNGADVAKHAVPAVPTQRISITFRKMDPAKVPVSFKPDKELLASRPLFMRADNSKTRLTNLPPKAEESSNQRVNADGAQFSLESDFPDLLSSNATGRRTHGRPQNLVV